MKSTATILNKNGAIVISEGIRKRLGLKAGMRFVVSETP
jgi:bifunctional DNA-binding transcriptional regulator/antitoxin component of YhaV-PrlF toxin-antitoxin module